MVISSPEIVIDVTEIEPGPPGDWTVNITVMLKLPDGSLVTAPAGSVAVRLQDIEEVTRILWTTIGTKDVDASGRVSFTGVTGAYYEAGRWLHNLYEIRATHHETGAMVEKDLWLDSQIPTGGIWKWPWEPFPYSEAARLWENPTAGGGNEGWPS